VIAMMTAATSQPNAIHAPPITIQRMLRRSDTGDMNQDRPLMCPQTGRRNNSIRCAAGILALIFNERTVCEQCRAAATLARAVA
jgi:hypothetical protein